MNDPPHEPKTGRDRVLIAITSSLACNFYRGVLGHLRKAGFEPVILSSPGANLIRVAATGMVQSFAVPIEREISPAKDLISLWRIGRVILQLRPTIVDASTPKAGLLTGIAAWLARVPHRVYTLRGLRLETATGLKRAVLWTAEWIACACAHRVVCVSSSLRTRAISLGLVSAAKTTVLGKGSGGVDLHRFSVANRHSRGTTALREQLGIPPNTLVVGFVGRFVRDKGIRQLIEAFQLLVRSHPGLRLLLVGDFEPGDPVEADVRQYILSEPAVIRPGFVSDTAPYYSLMDVLALPTYREGFPGVPLEAQASSVPVVTTNATGAADSVVDGVTGIIVPCGATQALATALDTLLVDPALRLRMGKAGRDRVERDFRPEVVWDALVHLYGELMSGERALTSAPLVKSIPWSKRVFDIVVATTGLLLLSPVLALLAILIRICLGAPILFRQERAGWLGSRFACLKFRTMTDARDGNGQLLPDGDRLTRLGRFLRSTSLDELPELVNVVRGEMSMVGPRPLLAKYLERYSDQQMRRHEVRPGITGWAQVNGRNALDWEKKFALDLWYVENQSFGLDLRILAATVWQVFRRDGIAKSGHVTMPEFLGVGVKHKGGNA